MATSRRKPSNRPAAQPAAAESLEPAESLETELGAPKQNLEVLAEPARRPDPRSEVVTVGECIVDGCPVLEFEPGRGLCDGHFTTRLDLREVARHD